MTHTLEDLKEEHHYLEVAYHEAVRRWGKDSAAAKALWEHIINWTDKQPDDYIGDE